MFAQTPPVVFPNLCGCESVIGFLRTHACVCAGGDRVCARMSMGVWWGAFKRSAWKKKADLADHKGSFAIVVLVWRGYSNVASSAPTLTLI